jgi:hypothetical protein
MDNDDKASFDLTTALDQFLAARLDALGLDHDTYGPYLLPVVMAGGDSYKNGAEDEDEWETVLELLQASSETHSDDAECWKQLQMDLENEFSRLNEQQAQVLQQRHEQTQRQHQELLQRDIQIAKEAALMQQQQKDSTQPTNERDVSKQALIARFAYEDEDDDLEAAEAEAAPASNQSVPVGAKSSSTTTAPPVTTKLQERQKTKQAREAKVTAKEERRKRAVKGERKR